MVEFKLDHISPIVEKWLQYGAWLYKINITTNKWLYYAIVFVIMIVFSLISCILISYVNYVINRGEHPRLNTCMTNSSAVIVFVATIIFFPVMMFPKSVFYFVISSEVNSEYHNILDVSGDNKFVVRDNILALRSDSGDVLNIADFSNSTSKKFILKPVGKTGKAYVKALSKIKHKTNNMYNLRISIKPYGTIIKWQDTKGNHQIITKAE